MNINRRKDRYIDIEIDIVADIAMVQMCVGNFIYFRYILHKY